MAGSISPQALEDFLEQVLEEIDPETAQYLEKLSSEFALAEGPIWEVIKNIMDERISAEEQEHLQNLCSRKNILQNCRQGKEEAEKGKNF